MRIEVTRPFTLIALLACLAVALAWAFAPGARGAGAAPAGGQRIAVVDISRVLRGMQETKEVTETLNARNKDLQAQANDKSAAVKQLQDAIRQLKPDSPQYNQKLRDLDQAAADLESWGKIARIQGERNQKLMMRNLFGKIKGVVGDIAKQQGYDLVLANQADEFPDLERINADQLGGLIKQQNILYAAKSIDISDAVLTQLDANYAKEKGAR